MTSEIRAELRELVSGRVGVADGVLPPLVFVILNNITGVGPAAAAGIGTALAITLWRLSRGRPVRFAVAGLLGTAVASGLALRSGSAQDFFLPGIVSGALTTAALLASVAVSRPLVAWTSWITRGWPIDWYWHPNVRPAYTRATVLWAAFFASRTLVQWQLFDSGEVELLGVARVLMGWPAVAMLLVATYVLGRRWLVSLAGPSVEEFESGEVAPWQGQQIGF